MDDGIDTMLGNDALDEGLIADIADDEVDVVGNCPGKTSREVVENDDLFAGYREVPEPYGCRYIRLRR